MVRPFEPVSQDRWIGNAVCYGPHRDGQRPGGPTPSAEEIGEDLRIMLRHWNLLRLYGSEEFGRTVLEVIRDHDLGDRVSERAAAPSELALGCRRPTVELPDGELCPIGWAGAGQWSMGRSGWASTDCCTHSP